MSEDQGAADHGGGPTVEVVEAEPRQRYEAHVDGALAGFAEYRRRDGRTVFTHTEVDDEFEGQGVGGALARAALDDVRARGELAVPVCPFIDEWIRRHPDYGDLVDHALYTKLLDRAARRSAAPPSAWPELPWSDWADTLETFHLWTQVVGKIRLVRTPWLNHSWSVPLYVSPRGLRTSLVPYGTEGFELAFDLVDHRLELTTTTGERRELALEPMSVARFHSSVLAMMDDVGMPVSIHPVPSELPDAVPFPEDHTHASYDRDHVTSIWRALLQAERVMTRFRAGFLGKASPVHLFWGSFDLATTRFSGRTAPPHDGGMPNFPDDVAREAYSHEVTSVGLWFGNRDSPAPVFYAYAYPTPDGFSSAEVRPAEAFWLDALGEFVLPYDVVAAAEDPDEMLRTFFESTHAAAAELAGWERVALECAHPMGPDWWVTRPTA
jgi:predicted GNAT family acetyltransferase